MADTPVPAATHDQVQSSLMSVKVGFQPQLVEEEDDISVDEEIEILDIIVPYVLPADPGHQSVDDLIFSQNFVCLLTHAQLLGGNFLSVCMKKFLPISGSLTNN